MPIQLSSKQATGVVTTYHVIKTVIADFIDQRASVDVASYLDQSSFAAGCLPVVVSSNDITAMLSLAAQASPLLSQIEEYLLSTPTFSGGQQVA